MNLPAYNLLMATPSTRSRKYSTPKSTSASTSTSTWTSTSTSTSMSTSTRRRRRCGHVYFVLLREAVHWTISGTFLCVPSRTRPVFQARHSLCSKQDIPCVPSRTSPVFQAKHLLCSDHEKCTRHFLTNSADRPRICANYELELP